LASFLVKGYQYYVTTTILIDDHLSEIRSICDPKFAILFD